MLNIDIAFATARIVCAVARRATQPRATPRSVASRSATPIRAASCRATQSCGCAVGCWVGWRVCGRDCSRVGCFVRVVARCRLGLWRGARVRGRTIGRVCKSVRVRFARCVVWLAGARAVARARTRACGRYDDRARVLVGVRACLWSVWLYGGVAGELACVRAGGLRAGRRVGARSCTRAMCECASARLGWQRGYGCLRFGGCARAGLWDCDMRGRMYCVRARQRAVWLAMVRSARRACE